MSFYHTLWVLSVKHMRERYRELWNTIFEMLLSVLTFALLIILKYNFHVQTISSKDRLDAVTNEIEKFNVLFTPYNNITKSIMRRVGRHFYMKKVSNESVMDVLVKNVWGFENENEIKQYLRDIDRDSFLVVSFKNLVKYPKYFNYSLGFTDRIEHENALYWDPYREKVATVSKVAALSNLQWALDKAYMEELYGQQISHTVHLKGVMDTSVQSQAVYTFLIVCTFLAPLPFFLNNVSRLVVEMRTGLKELMKMAGVSSNVLRLSQLIDTGIMGIIYATLITTMLKVTSQPILPYSNPIIIAFTLILHYLNITSLAFVTSSLSQDYEHAESLALLIYLMTFLLDTIWYSRNIQKTGLNWLLALCLPHAPIYLFWNGVLNKETMGKGLGFSNLFSVDAPDYVPVIVLWGLFLFQQLVILILAWYVELIRPGKYGVAAKWNFLCNKKFWIKRKKKKVNFHMTAEKSHGNLRDDRYFEKKIKRSQVAIKVANVTKVFYSNRKRSRVALRNVSMDMCKGEITVLLGPNGAGKTTLLSVITGMYSATSGSVYINGLDNSTRLLETRQALGYCPQSNVTFNYLTVKENIKFFQSLKRVHNTSSACTNAEVLMTILKLNDKADLFHHQLSDNAKRCLQVACALAADAELLVLDEPTSGMNSKSRHRLWELLLVLRGVKTILISTTLMEEADALADRIALLHRGHLKCHGTPSFLKQAIGTEFKLTVHIRRTHKVEKLQEVIESIIPVAVSMTTRGFYRNRVMFGLPAEAREHFPKLFDMLQEKKKELGIISMVVGMCWEQVFLNFLEDEEIDVRAVEDEFLNSFEDVRYTGWRLWKQQVRALMNRNITFLWTHKYRFIILQVILPLLGLMVVTITSNKRFGYGQMGLGDVLENMASPTLLHNPDPLRADVFGSIRQQYPDIEIATSLDISKDMNTILSSTADAPHHRHVFGIRMEDLDTEIFYPVAEYATVSEAINMFSNMYMAVNIPYAANNSIRTSYNVLSNNDTYSQHTQPKSIMLCIIWSAWVAFLVTVPLAPFVLAALKEHVNGVRFNHVLAGCSPTIIWLSKLVVHSCIYLLIVPPSLLLMAFSLDFDKTFDRTDFLLALGLILVEFGPAFIVHLYALSYLLDVQHALGHIYIMTMCLALITPLFFIFLGELHNTVSYWISIPIWIIAIVSLASPASTFNFALSRLTLTARSNAYCRLNKHLCPDLRDDAMVSSATCCQSTSDVVQQYYSDYHSGLVEFIVFVVQFIAYWIVLMLLQNRVIQNWMGKLHALRKTLMPEPISDNENVNEEKRYVQSLKEKMKGKTLEEREELLEGNVILVDNASKHFQYLKKSSHVNSVSFTIKKGECLGILGLEGCGKTTLLKMVSGFTAMTKGNACVAGYFIREDRKMYLRHMAWTRSDGGLDNFLTGFENLTLLAELYGRPRRLAEKLAMHYLQFMGLQSFANEEVEKYSAGCSRLLAMCGALLAEPSAALFDQPATGFDLQMQPLATRAVRRLLERGAACLITEASINWRQIELICNRIAIMCQGEIVAIGPATQVRETYASGHTAIFKLKISSYRVKTKENQKATLSKINVTSSSDSSVSRFSAAIHVERVDELKVAFADMFENSYLTNEHLTMLYFHIETGKKKLHYGEIFTKLETLNSEYSDIVEGYSLGETTIAEVFNTMERNRINEIKEMALKKSVPDMMVEQNRSQENNEIDQKRSKQKNEMEQYITPDNNEMKQNKSKESNQTEQNRSHENSEMKQNRSHENNEMEQNRTPENNEMEQNRTHENNDMGQNRSEQNNEMEQNITPDNHEVKQNGSKESNEREQNITHENNEIEQNRTHEDNKMEQNRTHENNDMDQNRSEQNNEMEQNGSEEKNEIEHNRTKKNNNNEHHRTEDSH